MKRYYQLTVAVLVTGMLFVAIFLSGCSGGGGGAPTPPPDMSPIGDGLSYVGMGIVLSAIISLIGILIRWPK